MNLASNTASELSTTPSSVAALSGISARAGHRPCCAATGARRTASPLCPRRFRAAAADPCARDARSRTPSSSATSPSPLTAQRAGVASARAIARIAATRLGLDMSFVVTNFTLKCPRTVYDTLYCHGLAGHMDQANTPRRRALTAVATGVSIASSAPKPLPPTLSPKFRSDPRPTGLDR
jgi:hypothetical protein